MHKVAITGIFAISVFQNGQHPMCNQDSCNRDITFGLKQNLEM